MKPKSRVFEQPEDLLAALRQAVADVPERARPAVIAIAGGSASGKTTIATVLARQLGGDAAELFSQDLFQLGADFADRKASPYKWDDPKNFDLPAATGALVSLRAGHPAVVPKFDVVSNSRQGTVTIASKPVIIWEGVYAFLTPELQTVCDVRVFVDVPYALRLLRRISRFLARETIDDISVPARHMLTFVLKADQDFVISQRQMADMVLAVAAADVQVEAGLLRQRAARHAAAMASLPQSAPLRMLRYGGLSFALYDTTFAITTSDGQVVYATVLPTDVVEAAAEGWSRFSQDID